MSKNAGKWAAGAVLAGVAGYVAGILTAPKSGRETRQDIKDAAIKARSESEKKLKTVLAQLNEQLEVVRKRGGELKGKAKDELEKAQARAIIAKDKVREILSMIHEGDADDPELKKALKDAKEALKHLQAYVKK